MKTENRKKRITAMHVCYLNPGSQSGYETRVVEETGLLKAMGLCVIIACFIGRDRLFPLGRLWRFYRRLKKATGAKIYIIPTSRYFDLSVPKEGVKGISRPLVFLAGLHKVDVIHGQALYSTMHILRAGTGAKVAFDVHGASPEETEMSGGHADRVQRLTEWEREALPVVDLRVFVSNRMKDFFKEKYGLSDKPSALIPCCVHSDGFKMSSEMRDAMRKELGVEDKFVILYLGTLSAWQWPEAMFSLFAQFHLERPESLFYLLLPRSGHEKALSFVKKHNLSPESYMIKEVPHSKVGSAIGIADAGLLLRKFHPVNKVSSPTKFGEYLAAGIPVIATLDIGDTSSLVEDEKVGLITSATDEGIGPEDLNRLLMFADDVGGNRAEWSKRCMDVAEARLGWKKRGSVLADAYRNILTHRGMEETNEKQETPVEHPAQSGPVFIGGTGRSGTTVVAWMLGIHPNIATVKWESHFMVDEVGLPTVIGIGQEALPDFLERMKGFWFRREVNNINRPSYWAGLADDIPEKPYMNAVDQFEKDIISARTENERLKAARRLINTLMGEFTKKRQKQRWAEKTPKNILCIDFLLKLYPDAKLINCIRDGRDVVASMVERQIWPIQPNPKVKSIRKGKEITVENAGFFWKENLLHARRLGRLHPNSYYELYYEALMRDPQKEMIRVADFLGEPFCDNWLKYNLKKDAIGRWKSHFSEEDKSILKKNAGELLVELGYEKDNDW